MSVAQTSHTYAAAREQQQVSEPLVRRLAPSTRGSLWFSKYRLMLVASDATAILLAVGATFVPMFTRDQPTQFGPLTYGIVAPVLVVVWLLSLDIAESRGRTVTGAGLKEYRRVISASLYVFGGAAIVSYALQASLSRAIFVTTLPLGIALLLLGRWFSRGVLNRMRRAGRALTPTLVIGQASSVFDTIETMRRQTDAGYRPTGVCLVGEEPMDTAAGGAFDDLTWVTKSGLYQAAADRGYGAVIVVDGLPRDEVRELAWRLERKPVDLMFQPRLTDVAGPRMKISSAEGLTLVHADLPQFTGWRLALKRAFDIVFSVIALMLLLPVFLVIAALIKLDDPKGPVFFRQERIGRNGQPFTIHKFRTMVTDAEAQIDALIAANGGSALLFKLEDDPRITKIGALLRKYSLDELPQFWSVLRGGMSVVGPRPQVAREVAEYTDMHHRRLLIKPGITGLWQVNGRSELSPEESIRLDLRYVENWSLIGDITVILKTVGVMLRPYGAY